MGDSLTFESHIPYTSGKHVRAMNTPIYPTFLYSKSRVCRGIPIFLIFAPKHTLWVLTRVPTIYALSKNKKSIKIFLLKFFNFYVITDTTTNSNIEAYEKVYCTALFSQKLKHYLSKTYANIHYICKCTHSTK